ncbi:MAG: hypothetical protein SNJ29_16735 [Rikenellaceae bacterium]
MNEFNFDRDFIPTMLKRPHLVILGAGASCATIIKGDKNGNKLSVMNNFIEELGMTDIFANINLKTRSSNLEDIYSELYERDDCDEIREELECRIKDYFGKLELPDEPTIYDYILLSLRNKDTVVSFNWDNLLIQAYHRVSKITNDLPSLAFLHGNISMGYCKNDNGFGYIHNKCKNCGDSYYPSQILFPVKKKDYNSDEHLKLQWNGVLDEIKEAAIITIFGYSAPSSDVEAIQLMLKAFDRFGDKGRIYDTIEIIDKPGISQELLYTRWENFITPTNDHVEILDSFFDSYMARFPRRSIEGYVKSKFEGCFIDNASNPYQENMNFEELKSLVKPLIDNENAGNIKVM